MHKTVEESRAYARHLIDLLGADPPLGREMVVIPPFLSVWAVCRQFAGTGFQVGAQNLDLGREGAMTGAVSAYHIAEAGARYVIVGHSERRQFFGETDDVVAEKAKAAHAAGLSPIVCIGEREDEFDAGKTEEVLSRQLAPVLAILPATAWERVVVAYEPVWAIGTGRVPTPAQADHLAGFIRQAIFSAVGQTAGAVRILYGGSVSLANIQTFWGMPDIDGALVGGASLKAADFARMAAVPLE